MDTLAKLKESFVTALEIPISEVQDSLSYENSAVWDSVVHMVLIAEIEKCFDVMLDTDDVIDLSSFLKAKEILRKNGVEI